MDAKIIGINGAMLPSKIEDIRKQQEQKILAPDCYQGTPQEILIEFAGRVCYDSAKYGEQNRSSTDYHKHIVEVGHTSVLAHGVITAVVDLEAIRQWCFDFAGEPGWYMSPVNGGYAYSLTCNLRFLERMKFSGMSKESSEYLYAFLSEANRRYPSIIPEFEMDISDNIEFPDYIGLNKAGNQCWISMLLTMSRSCSAEWNRHSFESAISQRSTRYCDESDAVFLKHPEDLDDDSINCVEIILKEFYIKKQSQIYNRLIYEGVDKFTARKQSRGAAARYLPMGVETQEVYTASLREWQEIFRQRISSAADGEINLLARKCRENIMISDVISDNIKEYFK